MKTGSFLSVSQAAHLLNLSPQQVRNLCRKQELESTKVGNSWIINREAILYRKTNLMDTKVMEDRPTYTIAKKNKPIALSFFSGAMGLDIGLELSGFETLLACEIDKDSRQTIVTNKPQIALIGDIRDYSAEQVKSFAGLGSNDDIDLIIGGPPCQAFSTAGKRKSFEDSRGNVFLYFIELALELAPKYLVIENVRGLLSAPLKHRPHIERGDEFPELTIEEQKGGALLHIISVLKDNGYSVSFNLYNSANFGSPQIRERVVIICSRDGEKVPYLTPSHSENGEYGLPNWKTFQDAVINLPEKPCDHINFPEKRIRFYKLLKPGQNWRDLPEELQKEALGKSYYAGGGKTGFLRRLAWDKPSPTVVTNPAMPATDLAHPIENRPLSIQEYKRLQEFPDNWKICGSLLSQYKQVGNAVPISLGQAIGKTIMNHIQGIDNVQYSDFQYSRYKNTNETDWEISIRENFEKLIATEYQLTLGI